MNSLITHQKNVKKILVTGCAGFIGSHLVEQLLKRGDQVCGIDIMNEYYDVKIKHDNIKILSKYSLFTYEKGDVCDTDIIDRFKPDIVVHMASMAGVRFSIENPQDYVKNNISGFVNIMEQSIKNNVKLVVYASSSSVYGLNTKLPFAEDDNIVKCNSPYAVSKLSMELYAKMYYQLYSIPNIGLRFFTVYGSRGRPDMAPYKLLNSLKNDTEFEIYGDGLTTRDYTHIDDIVKGIISAIDNNKNIKCEVYNLGNSTPITLNEFIKTCEDIVGKKGKFVKKSDQLGDVPHTCADISKALKDLDYNPTVKLEEGIKKMYSSMIKSD